MRLFASHHAVSRSLAVLALSAASLVHAAPESELKGELLYRLLEGEFSMQYGDINTAASRYLWAARRTQDPAVAQRAFEICWQAGSRNAALEAAQIWHKAAPASLDATEKYGSALLVGPRSNEGVALLRSLLKTSPNRAAALFTQLPVWLEGDDEDKTPRLPVIEAVTQGHEQLPEARYVQAIAAFQDNKPDVGLPLIEKALKARPRWSQAALVKAWLLQQKAPASAVRWLQDWQKRYGASPLTNEYLARLNLKQQNLAEARRDFERQAELSPEDPRAAFAAGYIAFELQDWPVAIRYLQEALARGYADSSTVLFYLGESQLQLKQTEQALKTFDAVTEGEARNRALRRAAQIRLQSGQAAEALSHVRAARTATPTADLWQLEADVLRNSNRTQDALQTVESGIKQFPNDQDLRYTRSMLYDRVGRYDDAEKDLRWLLQKQPDDATTLNALGYLLADRTTRFQEALDLLERAHARKPEDPFILDSLGWVYYKLGRLEDSVERLQQAWKVQPDPEIAAHLVETLWKLGRKDDARSVLAQAYQQHPDHEALKNVERNVLDAR